MWLCAQSSTQNYIATAVPYQTVSDANTLSDVNSNTSIQYVDGLGRPSQTVQRAITPLGADLVSGIQYDNFGRDNQHWLPAVAGGNNGAYYQGFASQSQVSNNDAKPYSIAEYEPSPLNRVTAQFGPGADWYNNNKKKNIIYTTNNTYVRNYYIEESQLFCGLYSAASLYKNQTTDEDGKTVEEFTDKLGRKVLSRVAGDHDTYYVYDDRNNLRYVLPPLAADQSLGPVGEGAGTTLDLYGYIYHYDGQNRCTEKKLPGCDWIYMVYDKADRLILSQDGNQRAKPTKQWTVTKYDAFGRVLYTGLINSNDSRATMESNYSGSMTPESYTGSGPVAGYTSANLTPTTVLTVNYYDNYGFLSYSGNNPGGMLSSGTLSGYDSPAATTYAKTLLTGTRVYHLDNPSLFEVSALYYDKYGRVVQSRASNHLGGYDITYSALDFTGKPTRTYKTHGINGASATITELYSYVYNKAQQLQVTTYSLNGGSTVVLALNTYDDFGRLTTKKRHTNADTESHTYNVRSWPTNNTSGSFQENLYYNNGLPSGVTPCYNGNIAMNTWTYNGAVKKYGYAYDALNRLTTSILYDANNQSSTSFSETFTFDKMGNVANLGRTGSFTQIDGLTLSYNGNQLTKVDDANGSRNLYDIKEYSSRNASGDDFAYDANGNMVKDLDRNIVTIQYNVLNLPDVIQFRNGNQIKNSYDAGGHKLGTEYFTQLLYINPLADGQIISQSYIPGSVDQIGNAYIGTMEYKTQNGNSSLTAISRIYNDEGYVENPGNPQYYYYRKDHLGDNREVWLANTGETVQRTQYYPSGLPWAYNAGDNPSKQLRKYNGKEFVEMHGYDTYDIVWRQYYPAIMRFQTLDPYAEKYYSLSTYSMCGDNTVNRTDPDGRQFPISPLFGFSDVLMSQKPIINETMTRVVRTTTEAGSKTIETSSNGGKTINVERINAGRQAETQQLQKLGLEKNTESFTRVDPKTGKDVTTIPDAYKNGQTTEIKNLGDGQKQSLTEQLRTQKELSNENGTNPRLHINKEAGLTKPLQNAGFDITKYSFIPPTQNNNTQTQKPVWQLYP